MDPNTEHQSETVLRDFTFTVVVRGNERESFMVAVKSKAAVKGLGKSPRHR